MSRLTGSPFHKPTPFEFPGAPVSPPDTNADIVGPSYMLSSSSILGGHELRSSGAEPSPAHSAPTPESAGARFRKISSMAYHTSGLRESRERTRASKAFVIIIPPTAFTREHGQLGHTLSSGPRHRLSQGLLMPLFSTMYGQLAAIAREYNFPSTTGLCLYPHFVENGVTMTPRISDETWPFIWSHVFEGSPSSRLPISGKIEFDIDMRQARWYASWIASSHRDYVDRSFSANPSIAHERHESRTTSQDIDDPEESRYVAPTARHVPRKLSLVDRYDITSSPSGSRPASRSALSPPEPAQVSSQVLSPIFQEEEPQSARNELDSRVKSWRASAGLKPTPLAATGQTSLEPANMPNRLPIEDTLLDTPDHELNLADFTWSISSAGPSDRDPMSPMSWDRLSSVHIADRMEGSVCLTPSDCTSFGPSDYTLPSPGPSHYRVPSPDIAHRMYEDMPATPSTATSWGAPLEFPPSPLDYYRAPSVDLGQRLVFSRPVTPSTATSWGPASCPSSPLSSEYRSGSIHLADRGDYSRPVTPSTATSWGAPSSYPPSPTTPFYVSTPDAGHRGFEDSDLELGWKHMPWGHSWPYSLGSSRPQQASTVDFPIQRTVAPWAFSWPYRTSEYTSNQPMDPLFAHSPSTYPRLVIYQPVYPYFDLYPAIVLAEDDSPGYPSFNLYPPQRLNASPQISLVLQPIVVKLIPCYPAFDLYPATYPGSVHEIYPPVVNDVPAAPMKLTSRYPFFDLYPAVYPHIMPYPPALDAYLLDKDTKENTQGYPDFDLYPAISARKDKTTSRSSGYPDFILHPPVEQFGTLGKKIAIALSPVSVTVKARYPSFNLYPAVYPYFDLYPALDGKDDRETSGIHSLVGYPHFVLYPPVAAKPEAALIKRTAHPVLDLQPIYSSVERQTLSGEDNVRSGYPYFELYPTVPRKKSLAPGPARLSTHAPCFYPIFNLYPAVYPFIVVYPTFPCTSSDSDIIAPGYPHFNLYPPSASKVEPPLQFVSPVDYPRFNLYPAVYPYFDLYPTIAGKISDASVETAEIIAFNAEAQYPAFDLYPAVYPYFNLWPAVDQPRMASPLPQCSIGRSAQSRLTHSELHAMVMMERVGSTGSFGSLGSPKHLSSKPIRSHDDLHHTVFPDGLVATPSGTLEKAYPEVSSRTTSFSDELLARRRVSTLRPSSTRLTPPAAPSPSRLPRPPPSRGARLSSAFESIPALDFEDDISPTRISPNRRAPSSRFPQDIEPRQTSGLSRSSSLMKSSSHVPELNAQVSRSSSFSTAPKSAPRRRDSIVSQRVRAFNPSQDDIELSMDALSKFPAPPMPPVPRALVPKALDPSKYAFAR
ncbi:hypothetical protein FPV67DRAFT_1713683 [Lyophyllum atratum]|nr:hypothetical protein FPV67DRAFT_1713683 [Lyophyllum atratum]